MGSWNSANHNKYTDYILQRIKQNCLSRLLAVAVIRCDLRGKPGYESYV